MDRSWLATLTAVGMISANAAVAADLEIQHLDRAGRWTIDYGDGSCSLLGTFGAGPAQVNLRLAQMQASDVPKITLYGPRFAAIVSNTASARVYYLPTGSIPGPRTVTVGRLVKQDSTLPMIFVSGLRFDNLVSEKSPEADRSVSAASAAAAVNAVNVEINGIAPFRLNTGSMQGAMMAMKACTDDLLRSWGFDPAELASRQSRALPKGNPGNWIDADDYPTSMLKKGQSARVDFRLEVDAQGRPGKCHILATTTPPKIGPYVCDLMARRAKFTPAIDANGNPAADFWISTVTHTITD